MTDSQTSSSCIGFNRHRLATAALAAVAAFALGGHAIAQTTQPAAPQARTTAEINADLQQTSTSLQGSLGGLAGLSDAKHLTEVGPKAIPLVKQMLADFDELQAVQPAIEPQLVAPRQQFVSILLALGDKQTQDKVNAEIASNVPAEKVHGESSQLMARWLTSGRDAEKQKPIVDDVQKLDEANTDSRPLTIFTAMLSQSAATPELKDRLRALASDTMKNPTATQLKTQLASMKEQEAEQGAADAKMKAMEGKPLVVAGKTVDGKDFTTADWKGKVVLVDFWATWCPPCRAELPRLKQTYTEDHAKGLEVLGVSNDYDATKLTDFTKKEDMPWPQLLDTAAAADHQWNPTTLGYGINGIPTMFLIDKKGICRSVTAREDMETLLPKLLSE